MSDEAHPLHIAVCKLFEDSISSDCQLIRDEDCGGTQHIPLFVSENKSRKTEYCNVDLLVLKKGKIKIIVEIEESNLKPTQVCGKYLTSALSRYYIQESEGNKRIEMDDEVTFIQIMDVASLDEERTKKFRQWMNLRESIRATLPVKGSNITNYGLFYGTVSDFKDIDYSKELVDFIQKAIQ